MIRRVFALTESGAKEISNKEPNVPIEGNSFTEADVRATTLDGLPSVSGNIVEEDSVLIAFAKAKFEFAAMSNIRRTRYVKSSGFTSSNSTTLVVVDSIPLGDPADLEDKRLHLLAIMEKVGANGALTVTVYLHNAAITIGSAPAGTQIATYTSAANQNDFPVERVRMFVSGGQLFPARPASTMLNDMIAQGAVLSGITIPSNAHIIIAASVQNASDSFQPRYITLEY